MRHRLADPPRIQFRAGGIFPNTLDKGYAATSAARPRALYGVRWNRLPIPPGVGQQAEAWRATAVRRMAISPEYNSVSPRHGWLLTDLYHQLVGPRDRCSTQIGFEKTSLAASA